MARFLRMALLWLSLFALPLHGMAGLTTPVCLSNGDMVCSTMAMPATSVSPDVNAEGDHYASADDLSKMLAINCGGNAVCHVSVALPATRFDTPSAIPTGAPPTYVPASEIRFFTGGPDRPPRRTFA